VEYPDGPHGLLTYNVGLWEYMGMTLPQQTRETSFVCGFLRLRSFALFSLALVTIDARKIGSQAGRRAISVSWGFAGFTYGNRRASFGNRLRYADWRLSFTSSGSPFAPPSCGSVNCALSHCLNKISEWQGAAMLLESVRAAANCLMTKFAVSSMGGGSAVVLVDILFGRVLDITRIWRYVAFPSYFIIFKTRIL
jgi:hypothetical protein